MRWFRKRPAPTPVLSAAEIERNRIVATAPLRARACPDATDFQLAGIPCAAMAEIKTRWPMLGEDERDAVLQRVYRFRDAPLDDLLNMTLSQAYER
jgi:hypothetical protein